MNGFQKSYLRGLGQTLRPAIHVGKKGLDEAFLRELSRLFEQNELIKVKFAALKEHKSTIAATIAEKTGSEVAGIVGHTVLLYRQHIDPKKREIRLPKRAEKTEATDAPQPEA
jgi:RNA-binding protein